MKYITLNLILTFIWSMIGFWLGMTSHFFNFIFFPLLFYISMFQIKHKLKTIIIIPFFYILILLNDLLFRFYGGGIHDDVGRALSNITFYITFLTTTLTMLYIFCKIVNNNKISRTNNSLIVIGTAIISYSIFMKFNEII